jgi:hypothetical protein
MRFGLWQGCAALLVLSATARANDLWPFHAIPREVPAVDFRTGEPMMAPAIPYGHYAKDYPGTVHGAVGHVGGLFHTAGGLLHGLHGDGCSDCGNGLGHGGQGCGNSGCAGLGSGCGAQNPCGTGSAGCGLGGHSLFKSGVGGLFSKCGGSHSTESACLSCATNSASAGVAHIGTTGSPQSVVITHPVASAQASPQIVNTPCGACGGVGNFGAGSFCGACKGTGLLKKLIGGGHGGMGMGGLGCGNCGSSACAGGCGNGGHAGNGLCGNCGKFGCNGGCLSGLKSHLGGALSHFTKYLPGHGIKYFVGPGGPVPITPGYVPYVNPVRAPRDFLSFPPYGTGVQ